MRWVVSSQSLAGVPALTPSPAYHLTRRARGLALWFSLAVHGTDAYRTAVEAALVMAQEAAARIEAAENLELVREPGLSIVLFRRRGWGPADYPHWSQELLASQVGFVTPTTWLGETLARFAFLHPDTTVEMVDEILATMTDRRRVDATTGVRP